RGRGARIRDLADRTRNLVDCRVLNAAAGTAETIRDPCADVAIAGEVIPLVDARDGLAVEHIEDVHDQIEAGLAESDRITEVQVGFILRRTASERSAWHEVVLIVLIASRVA